jgi:hypothetical protein
MVSYLPRASLSTPNLRPQYPNFKGKNPGFTRKGKQDAPGEARGEKALCGKTRGGRRLTAPSHPKTFSKNSLPVYAAGGL